MTISKALSVGARWEKCINSCNAGGGVKVSPLINQHPSEHLRGSTINNAHQPSISQHIYVKTIPFFFLCIYGIQMTNPPSFVGEPLFSVCSRPTTCGALICRHFNHRTFTRPALFLLAPHHLSSHLADFLPYRPLSAFIWSGRLHDFCGHSSYPWARSARLWVKHTMVSTSFSGKNTRPATNGKHRSVLRCI